MPSLQSMIRSMCDSCPEMEVDYRARYSGRGMYGQECVGILGQEEDCMQLIAEVIKELHVNLASDEEGLFDEAVSALMRFDKDNMGMSGVILYWIMMEPEEDAEPDFVEDLDEDSEPENAIGE